MIKPLLGLGLLLAATTANATDFGIRDVGGPLAHAAAAVPATSPMAASAPRSGGLRLDLGPVASMGAHWGRVTSTLRSAAHNRAVGGVANSWHLKGRAVDIARRAGVTHAMIAAAFRGAGYHLIESLDEGDHSHFAFSDGERLATPRALARLATEATRWGIVMAPRSHGR